MGTEIQVGPSGTKLLPLSVASGHSKAKVSVNVSKQATTDAGSGA
jgi:hypothetical protein